MTILRSQRDLYDRFHQEAEAIDAAAGSPPSSFRLQTYPFTRHQERFLHKSSDSGSYLSP